MRHLDQLRHDLRSARRTLGRHPGFTAVAVATLALGLGANGAIFSLIDGILLRPLPYPEPDRLVWLWSVHPESGDRSLASLHDFTDWRRGTDAFAELAVFETASGNLTGDGTATRVSYALVSDAFFDAVGVAPARGRTFRDGEDRPERDRVAVVSHGFWQRELGGDPGVPGTTLTLEGERLTVVGVMPPGFDFPPGQGTELWKPLGMTPEESGTRDGRWIAAVGRLAPGVTLAAAQSRMDAVCRRLAAEYPETNAGWTVELVPLRERVVGGARTALLTFWAAVGVVLAIVCANLAHLLLARGTARRREMALRAALGAGRARLVRQLVTESVLLAVAGGLLGLGLADGAVRLLPALAAGRVPRLDQVAVDLRIAGFTLALALVTGLVCGLLPALRSARGDLAGALKDGNRGGGAGGGGVRAALVVAEVALALVVLVAAGLLARSFERLTRVDTGFDARSVLTLRVAPPRRTVLEGLSDEEAMRRLGEERVRVAGFYRELLERLTAIPGVGAASAVNQRPLAGGNAWISTLAVEGRGSETSPANVGMRAVMPGYFETLGIPLIRGRALSAGDDERAARVAVVSQALADAYFPGADPLGRRIALDGDAEGWSTIVGVVGDVRDSRLEREPNPLLYWNLPQARWGHFLDWGMDLVVRAETSPRALVEPIGREVQALDKSLPVFRVGTLDEVIRGDLAERRFAMALVAVFAALALALTAVGIYGVMAYSVGLRRHEMGLRMALGASRPGVLSLIVRQGMALVAAGLALGSLAAWGATRWIASLLYGVAATDPATFVLVAAVLAASGLAACVGPARRATRVDPASALRCE